MRGNFQRNVVMDVDKPINPSGIPRVALYNPDGTPFEAGQGPKGDKGDPGDPGTFDPDIPVDHVILKDSNDVLWVLTVTTDGTLDISEVP